MADSPLLSVDQLTSKFKKDLLAAGVSDAFVMVRDPSDICMASNFKLGSAYWIYGACKQEIVESERLWEMDNVEAFKKDDDNGY